MTFSEDLIVDNLLSHMQQKVVVNSRRTMAKMEHNSVSRRTLETPHSVENVIFRALSGLLKVVGPRSGVETGVRSILDPIRQPFVAYATKGCNHVQG